MSLFSKNDTPLLDFFWNSEVVHVEEVSLQSLFLKKLRLHRHSKDGADLVGSSLLETSLLHRSIEIS